MNPFAILSDIRSTRAERNMLRKGVEEIVVLLREDDPHHQARKQPKTPQYAVGDHVLVAIDGVLYRAEVTEVKLHYVKNVHAYVVGILEEPGGDVREQILAADIDVTGIDAHIAGLPCASLDW